LFATSLIALTPNELRPLLHPKLVYPARLGLDLPPHREALALAAANTNRRDQPEQILHRARDFNRRTSRLPTGSRQSRQRASVGKSQSFRKAVSCPTFGANPMTRAMPLSYPRISATRMH